MQTFLPFPDFRHSAACLDSRRLGKQRVETIQVLKALTIPNYGWRNHPAVKMWKGSLPHLVYYGLAICDEWKRRGFRDTCTGKILAFLPDEDAPLPAWLGSHDFHASHRSNLLRKDPTHYGKFNWSESPDLPYIWPQP